MCLQGLGPCVRGVVRFPLWPRRFLVWLWARLTFRKTRERVMGLSKEIMTNSYGVYVPGRVLWVWSALMGNGLQVYSVVGLKTPFVFGDYAIATGTLLGIGGVGVWLDAKASKTEATTPPVPETPESA